MKPLLLSLLLGLSHAAETNFFISPGSQSDQLASGNHSSQYPVYQEHQNTLFTWNTNWTTISLLLYQNENASYIRLLDFEKNPPNSYSYDMSPNVNLTWNDVFFLTLWNENWSEEGGVRFFSSSYFRINASDPTTTTTTIPVTTSTATPSPTVPVPETNTNTNTNESSPQTTTPSDSDSNSAENSGLSPPAKVGLGLGLGLGIPFLALAGVAIFYFRRRAQATAWQQQQQQPPATEYPYHPGPQPSLIPVSELENPSPFKIAYTPPQTHPPGLPEPEVQELPAR